MGKASFGDFVLHSLLFCRFSNIRYNEAKLRFRATMYDRYRVNLGVFMKKWYDEEYEFTVEVTGFLRGDHTEHYCRNGEEIGDKYTCTYGCPVNKDGYGICSKTMMMLYPLMEAVRSGGDLENVGGEGKYTKTVVCPDGCVIFKLTAKPLGNENFHKGKFWGNPDEGR